MPAKNLAAASEQNYLCRIHNIRRATERLGLRRSVGALGCAVCPPSPSTRWSSCRRLRPDCGPNSPTPLAPRCRNTWRRSCDNWMGIITSTQGRGVNMGQAQQNRRAVLIVEDDAELREFAARLLEDGELDTIECESAEAALATMLIRGQDVAMIFADIRLPGVMDGIDLAREVRMRSPFLPVILTSGHPPEGQLPLGVDFMPKPWQPLNLLVAAKQALSVSVRLASKAS